MEIVDYLKAARRRAWLLVLIPLLATAAAVAYVGLAPATYSASARISTATLVGGPWSQYTGPQAVDQFAGAFAATAASPVVIQSAAEDAGISPAQVRDGLTVTQIGASSNMSLTYSGRDAQKVGATVTSVTTETLKAMFSPQVALAEEQVSTADDAVRKANAAIAKLADKYHVADPPSAYNAALGRLSWLQQQQVTLRSTGKLVESSAMGASIDQARKDVAKFRPILEQYNNLQAAQASAVNDLGTARSDYRKAEAQFKAANPANIMYTSHVHATDRVATGTQIVLPVLGASIFLALAVVAIMELLAARRREEGEPAHSRRRATAAGPEDVQPTPAMSHSVS